MLFWYVIFLIKYFIWADTCIKMLWKGNNSLFFFFLEKIWPNAERKNGTWHSRSEYQSEKKTFIGGEKITVNKVHLLTYRNRKAANPTSVYLNSFHCIFNGRIWKSEQNVWFKLYCMMTCPSKHVFQPSFRIFLLSQKHAGF